MVPYEEIAGLNRMGYRDRDVVWLNPVRLSPL
jgi:hypothetical protein